LTTETQAATATQIQPLGDRVVVKPSETETQRPSGIYVAETAKEKPQKGTVVAVGPGRWDEGQVEPMYVEVGDTVLFAKYAGNEFKLDDEDVLILKQSDILAKITS
jgi:chaperonin GroES